MSIQEIKMLGRVAEEEKKLSLMLAIHCAPILSGLKAANMITLAEREFFQMKYLLQETNISYHYFKIRNNKGILYLYRERRLAEYLRLEEIKLFLKTYGYISNNLDEMIGSLEKRIDAYCVGKAAFPHEIGIFLEYPLADVIGFLENEGKNFVCSGYWKVYHNAEDTVRKFRLYDRERERMIKAVISGQKIWDIIV